MTIDINNCTRVQLKNKVKTILKELTSCYGTLIMIKGPTAEFIGRSVVEQFDLSHCVVPSEAFDEVFDFKLISTDKFKEIFLEHNDDEGTDDEELEFLSTVNEQPVDKDNIKKLTKIFKKLESFNANEDFITTQVFVDNKCYEIDTDILIKAGFKYFIEFEDLDGEDYFLTDKNYKGDNYVVTEHTDGTIDDLVMFTDKFSKETVNKIYDNLKEMILKVS